MKGKNLSHIEKNIKNRSMSQELSGTLQTFNSLLYFNSYQYQIDEIVQRRKELGQDRKEEEIMEVSLVSPNLLSVCQRRG